MKYFLIWFFSLISCHALEAQSIVNVYAWGGEIPKQLLEKFTRETGITVHFSTYDSNETMYAKLRANTQSNYDIILPSAYYVERMRKQGMLKVLDHQQLPNIKNLAPRFRNNNYDPDNQYSVPLTWGATGIFYNDRVVHHSPKNWHDLWDKRWQQQLMLPDDARELFAIALISLHRAPDNSNADAIHDAYQRLHALVPNIKLFASESIQAILIDEDAIIGAAWNGDVLKAHAENKHIHFIYPKDGFIMWIDCLSILNNAPHPDEAYQFINFLLNARNAAEIALKEGHAITNQAGIDLLPKSIRNNPTIYPSPAILQRAHLQRHVKDDALTLYHQYWQSLKLSF